MQPHHFLPPASLAPFIAFYGIIDTEPEFYEPYVSPPLGVCGFILQLEGTISGRLNGQPFMKDNYCITGQITAPMIGETSGRNKTLMVFIHPCGLHQLFGIDMSTLTNTSMPLQELLGELETDALIARLKKASDHKKMIAVMDEFFLAQLPVFEIAPIVKKVIDYIHEEKGNVSIKDIEKNCFITSRTLERHFKIYIGLSPKDYIRIYRFKCLINYIHQNPETSWSKLCEQYGYYDQAHLTRHFTKYLKTKPNGLVNLDLEYITYLLQA